jgi:hypothetical protein
MKAVRSVDSGTLLKVEGSVRFLDGVKNCTDSVHKFSRAFLLCYEFVQFLTPSKNLTDPSTFRSSFASLLSCVHRALEAKPNVIFSPEAKKAEKVQYIPNKLRSVMWYYFTVQWRESHE